MISESLEPNSYNPKEEQEKRPEVLYRAFTVNPEELTVDMLSEVLIPGMQNENDPTKIGDGNELGVYMSTNRLMIEQAYASPSGGVPIKSPQYKDNRGLIMNYIPLPKCGIVVEVRTDNLPIRKPEISEVLKGVYNNGYEGDEWIADQVPKSQYRVIRLILSLYSNDSKKLVVDISGDTKEELEKAINIIKTEFEKRKEWGLRYKSFLEGLDSKVRMNEYLLKREWEKFDKGQ